MSSYVQDHNAVIGIPLSAEDVLVRRFQNYRSYSCFAGEQIVYYHYVTKIYCVYHNLIRSVEIEPCGTAGLLLFTNYAKLLDPLGEKLLVVQTNELVISNRQMGRDRQLLEDSLNSPSIARKATYTDGPMFMFDVILDDIIVASYRFPMTAFKSVTNMYNEKFEHFAAKGIRLQRYLTDLPRET